MESKTIKCFAIYDRFYSEFFSLYGGWFPGQDNKKDSIKQTFNKFIDTKGLGVRSIDFINDIYEIVDEKKWVLTKLKYGI